MRNSLSAAAVLLALLAWHAPASAEPVKGDFKTSWNTWQTSQKGDWVEMDVGGIIKKVEVLETGNDGKVKYRETITAPGQAPVPREYTRHWSQIRFQVPPENGSTKVTWEEAECELAGTKLKCIIATATTGTEADGVTAGYWYSADVPCGGLIKTTTNGEVAVAVTAFHTAARTAGGEEKKAEPAAAKLSLFFGTVGNFAVYKVTIGDKVSHQRREVIAVENGKARHSAVACDETGKPVDDAKATEAEETETSATTNYGEITDKAAKVKVTAGEFTCEKRTLEKNGDTITAWLYEGMLVRLERTTKAGSATLELVKFQLK
ncbi:MAG: hypothetical protein IT463_12140 [Planctomycetes bacterium]|nr:hypothetical protein [Planctomycetota bacterium]